MVQKNPNLNYGGNWVFPGGMVEAIDQAQTPIEQAKLAAARETKEETNLNLEPKKLITMSHWVTPVELSKRYATWFFLTNIKEQQELHIDNQEIIDARWIQPTEALRLHKEKQMKLNGPAFVSLIILSAFENSESTLKHFSSKQPAYYYPRGIKTESGLVTLFQDDAGYKLSDEQALSISAGRHRTLMNSSSSWQYIQD